MHLQLPSRPCSQGREGRPDSATSSSPPLTNRTPGTSGYIRGTISPLPQATVSTPCKRDDHFWVPGSGRIFVGAWHEVAAFPHCCDLSLCLGAGDKGP